MQKREKKCKDEMDQENRFRHRCFVHLDFVSNPNVAYIHNPHTIPLQSKQCYVKYRKTVRGSKEIHWR